MPLQIESNRSLSEFSTFGIGGSIRYFVQVSTIVEMEEAFHFANGKRIPYLVLGKGSNCLFSDRGFSGLVILNKIDFSSWDTLTFGSGYNFSLLGVQTARKGLSGLEFASGIPATVGGAVFMNAGANGKETCEVLKSVLFLHEDGRKEEMRREDLSFSYRTSPFQKMRGAILSAAFALISKETARKSQLEIIDYRMKTQPYKDKSAGCVFRNPGKGLSSGALIDQSGLKGFSIGGAKVSEMHANFIVNTGNAKAQDVLDLIEHVQKKVFEKTGEHIEPEIRLIGFDAS